MFMPKEGIETFSWEAIMATDAKPDNDWIEWSGDASTIPSARGHIQFVNETREQALRRGVSQLDYWPWFGEDAKPCVIAYRIVGDAA